MHIYVSRKSGLRTRWVFLSTERKAEKGIGTVNVLGIYRVVKLRKQLGTSTVQSYTKYISASRMEYPASKTLNDQ